MTGKGDAQAAFETDKARSLDSCGGFASHQGGNLVAYNQRGGYGVSETGDLSPTLQAEGGTHQGGPGRLPLVAYGDSGRMDSESETFIAMHETGQGFWQEGDQAGTLRAEGENGPSRPSNVVAIRTAQTGSNGWGIDESGTSYTMDGTGAGSVLAFQSSQSGVREVERHATLDGNNGSRRQNGVMLNSGVRRLTPTECERLQSFPDGWTMTSASKAIYSTSDGLGGEAEVIGWEEKPQSDSTRYRQLGNAVCVSVAQWIGQRIVAVANDPTNADAGLAIDNEQV